MQNLFKRLMPLLSLSVLAVTGCFKEGEIPHRRATIDSTVTNLPRPLIVEIIQVVLQIEDWDMKAPIEDTTLLWDNHEHIPIIAPDGHQVTSVNLPVSAARAKLNTPVREPRLL